MVEVGSELPNVADNAEAAAAESSGFRYLCCPLNVLEPYQRELLIKLERYDEDLSVFYWCAVTLVNEKPTRIRLRILGHCMRELLNLASRVLQPDDSLKFQPVKLDRLTETWNAHSLPETQAELLAITNEGVYPIPIDIAEAIVELVEDSTRATNRAKKRMAALATGEAKNIDHHATILLRDAHGFFMKMVHLDGELIFPSEEELRRHFYNAETVLDSRTDGFFASVENLEEVLSETNEVNE